MDILNRRKSKIDIVDASPLCACGCLRHVKWNKWVKRWPMYLHGHHRRKHPHQLPTQLCECGCGEITNPGCRFIGGHNRRKKSNDPRLCACGCLQMTKRGCKFIKGHYIKKEPKLIELHLCECGCGELCKNRFVSGHNSRNPSEERRQQLRENATGRTHTMSLESRQELSELRLNNPHVYTEEERQRSREVNLGKIISEEQIQKIIEANTNRVLTAESIKRMSEARLKFYRKHPEAIMRGEKSPFYIDGRCSGDYRTYPVDFNERLKDLIRERDEFKCQLCSLPQEESKVKLSVHHINYDRENCDPRNLITLCRSCHGKTTKNRDKWITFFQSSQKLTLVVGGEI